MYREVKQRKEKPGRTAEEKTDLPFQGQEEEEKKEEEFLTGVNGQIFTGEKEG